MKIVITGVTRGLGRALAEWCIANGHQVAGCGRSGQEIFNLRVAHPETNDFAPVDITQPVKVSIWAEKVAGIFGGPPDFLVNNAAVVNAPTPLWEVPADKFAQLISINVVGVQHVIRAFVPPMIEANRGVIVNLSSGWGRSVSAGFAPYCASKWAIEGLTKALAQDLPAGMAAVPLNPGIIDTAMLRQCFEDGAGEYPKPEEWAKRAGPFILGLGPKDNGESLSVPD